MNHLPPAVAEWLEGSIDPYAQHIVETRSQTFFVALTVIAFISSYVTGSVLIPLEVFLAGLAVLLAIAVPPWSYLNRHQIKFLPARNTLVTAK